MSLRMTKKEREAFLAEPRTGVFSFNDPGRAPLSAPMWFYYDAGSLGLGRPGRCGHSRPRLRALVPRATFAAS
jgi:nitroimidazol reductase NimA-like FMN-containing flavoprotein (pyridoxamine 5'-phosphate oxidase superfamily)